MLDARKSWLTGSLLFAGIVACDPFSALTAGGGHTCSLPGARVAYCWGSNDAGQLGDGSTTHTGVPVKVAGRP